jgi:hypothetical protein
VYDDDWMMMMMMMLMMETKLDNPNESHCCRGFSIRTGNSTSTKSLPGCDDGQKVLIGV